MLVGVRNLNRGRGAGRDLAVATAEACAMLPVDSVWAADRTVLPVDIRTPYPYQVDGQLPFPVDEPFLDPFVWLAAIAALNPDVLVATGVLVLPLRHPLAVASQLAALDVLSAGRTIAGVGAGWLREEFDALGVPFDTRGDQLDEAISVMRAVWSGKPVSFSGRTVAFEEVVSSPMPVRGHIPLVVGGHSSRAARRAAESGDGFFPNPPRAAQPLIDEMRCRAAEVGRDPGSIEVTVAVRADDFAVLPSLRDAGVNRVLVEVEVDDPEELCKKLAQTLERIESFV